VLIAISGLTPYSLSISGYFMVIRRFKIKRGFTFLRGLSRRAKILLVFGLIMLLAVVGLLLSRSNHREEKPQVVLSCSQVVDTANDLALRQKLDEAINLLSSNEPRCTQIKDPSIEAKVGLFAYYVAIASVSYNRSDKVKAYDYAKKAVKEHDAIPATPQKNFSGMSENEVMLLNILESQQAEHAAKGQTQ